MNRFVILFLTLFLAFASAAWAAEGPLLGVSLNVPEGSTGQDLIREIQNVRKAGVQLMCVSYKWSDLERTPGKPDLKELEDGVRGLSYLGYQIAITLQTLDTSNRTLPSDLQNAKFDSPAMRERFDSLLRAIAAKLNGNVKWVMIGNEVDIYLKDHPDEVEAYAGFIERGRQTLRAAKPGLMVGSTTTFNGIHDVPAILKRINRGMDVVTMTYYLMGDGFKVRPVSDFPGDVDTMVRTAAGKPLLMQEIGMPADPLLNGSEEKQAQFVDMVFDTMSKHKGQIAGFNYFLLCDFSSKLVDTFLSYYRLPDPHFRAYLATLGLKRADGTPRKAWERFQVRAKQWEQTGR